MVYYPNGKTKHQSEGHILHNLTWSLITPLRAGIVVAGGVVVVDGGHADCWDGIVVPSRQLNNRVVRDDGSVEPDDQADSSQTEPHPPRSGPPPLETPLLLIKDHVQLRRREDVPWLVFE